MDVDGTGSARSGPIHGRPMRAEAALRVLSVRRRGSAVHRQRVRHDRGDTRARDHRAAVPSRAGGSPEGRPPAPDHASPAGWTADDPPRLV